MGFKKYLPITIFIFILVSFVVALFYASRPKDGNIKVDVNAPGYSFTLPDVDGKEYSLKDIKGDKPIVLAFYASWCPTCQVSAPLLSQMSENYKNDVTIWGIDSKESGENVKGFIEEHNIKHPVLVDEEGFVALDYGVGYNSFFVLLNSDGTVYKKISGEIKEQDVVDLIDAN